MKELEVGMKHKIEYKVAMSDSASAIGSGLLEVYSTPAMIALMEKCSMELVQSYLESGQGTVGISVNIKHLKATKIGEIVSAEAELLEIDGKRFRFKLNVSEGQTLIGTGEHERFTIDENKFIKNL